MGVVLMSGKDLRRVAAARQRIALVLTASTMFVYFGFILLVAWGKGFLGGLVVPGLSVGMALGSFVILTSWVLTGVYVWWANRHYDGAVEALSAKERDGA
jgi:uncharacterized membrane protein (DUF485 family)